MINSTDTQRDSWKTNWGFVLSCIGFCRWNGQYMDVSRQSLQIRRRHFLLPYFLFVIMIGLSGVIGEMAFLAAPPAPAL